MYFYEYEDNIKEEEYITFIETLLDVNRIQAYKIYRNKKYHDGYKEIEKYIISKRKEKSEDKRVFNKVLYR